jgi:hypothetical protein
MYLQRWGAKIMFTAKRSSFRYGGKLKSAAKSRPAPELEGKCFFINRQTDEPRQLL